MKSAFFILLSISFLLVGCKTTKNTFIAARTITATETPYVVMQAVSNAVACIKISEIEVETIAGQVIYDIEGTVEGREYEIEVHEDGKVIDLEAKDTYFDNKVPLSEVPAKILKAARSVAVGIKITEVEREMKDDQLIYEIEGLLDGKEYEIKVNKDGKVLKIELDD